MANRKVVFSIVGWMRDYKGPTSDDPPPEGGGKFVRDNVGYEAWNFQSVKGNRYAYVTTLSKNHGVKIQRIQPNSSGDRADEVLLVFLSKVPSQSKHESRKALPQAIGEGVRVVGWYRRGTLFSHGQDISRTGEQRRYRYKYNAMCTDADAFCVPELERKDIGLDGLNIHGPGGFKMAHVRYPFKENGERDSYFSDCSSWVARVLSYIDSYKTTPHVTVELLYPDELTEPEKYPEGARKLVTVNAYERDNRARNKCIEKYGYRCAVCCFDFYDTYGKIGMGFVHVHHLIPLYKVGKQYRVDPVKDLRPVCPNCHAMLHRSGGVMTIDSLRKVLNPKFTLRK